MRLIGKGRSNNKTVMHCSMAAGRKPLLEDEDEEDEVAPKLKVNEAYAKRFVHNKERADLHRLQELKKDGRVSDSDDEDSTSEDEDEDGLLPVKVDEKIFDTLAKIRRRDPSIYKPDASFFDDADDEDGDEDQGNANTTSKKQKPQYLKDVIARQLLEGGPEVEEEEDFRKEKPKAKSYFTEQDELKRAFLEGVKEAEEEAEEDADNLLRVKAKTKEEIEKEKKEAEEAIAWAEQKKKDADIARRLEEYFGKDDDLDDNDRFLKEYLVNKGWVDEDLNQGGKFPGFDRENELLSEDEEALEQQDEYEADYNFRFEQGDDNTFVKGHSRIMDDSVRKKSETRKKQREAKKQRLEEEERARQDELKRLKNLKKKEIMEKLEKIRTVAGVSGKPGAGVIDEDDLEEDFDPEEYDKKMRDAFGDEYYGDEDPEFHSDEDLEKPDFDAEDELLGIGPEINSSKGGGFSAVKANLSKKVKVPFEEKVMIEKHLEEYYKLDYEDMVGDLPTRFHYTKVKPSKYGLKTKDILALDDKELNQYVSVKKLAPYSTQEWKPKGPAPRLSKKARQKKAIRTGDSSRLEVDKIQAKTVEGGEDAGQSDHPPSAKDNAAVDAGDVPEASGAAEGKKKRKRKKSKSKAPLPQSRMQTYIPPAKKKKVKW
ncbi:hypothetical protein R1sor_008098 [Riccia sorocarpa]|uniref:Kri1-like C-terminal domain-containing protein n=1 Tax=Riccia sorocarpa TaxID=122646 RepID=A0ABD3HV88_9MARC